MIERDEIEKLFDSRSMLGWQEVMAIKEMMGFSDKLTDSELIEENNWIIQQFRKYVETKRGVLAPYMEEEDYKSMLEKLVEMEKVVEDKYATDRKTLVYHQARNSWLINTKVYLAIEINTNGENDDNREEW